jgi:tRNA(fMet)-specific endonuclease VapC
VNRALLDTDILSELFKGVNPTIARNASVYRQAFGRYTLSAITVMEIISGLQRVQSPPRGPILSLAECFASGFSEFIGT